MRLGYTIKIIMLELSPHLELPLLTFSYGNEKRFIFFQNSFSSFSLLTSLVTSNEKIRNCEDNKCSRTMNKNKVELL